MREASLKSGLVNASHSWLVDFPAKVCFDCSSRTTSWAGPCQGLVPLRRIEVSCGASRHTRSCAASSQYMASDSILFWVSVSLAGSILFSGTAGSGGGESHMVLPYFMVLEVLLKTPLYYGKSGLKSPTNLSRSSVLWTCGVGVLVLFFVLL